MHDDSKNEAARKVASGPPPRPRVVVRNDKPTARKRAKPTTDEFPRFVAMVLGAFEKARLDPHPDVVSFLAVCVQGDVENDRRLIAAKIDEIAESHPVVTAGQLEWVAHHVREAPRDVDGDFPCDVKETEA